MAVTISEETYGSVKKIIFTWSSDGSGDATGTTTMAYNGALERLVTVPGTGGAAPSASYDITVLDQDSTDVLMGAGLSRAAASTEQVKAASLGVIANDTMSIVVANAGASNSGVAYVYLR